MLLFLPWFRLEPWNIPIGPYTLPIQPFGVLVACAVLLGARMAEWFARRQRVDPALVADFVTHVVVGGFIFGIVLNALFYEWTSLVDSWNTGHWFKWFGMSSFGGFIGGVVGLLVWKYRRGLPVMQAADATLFAFPFGWIFGRSGCFVVHDHPGRVTDFFLAVGDYHFGNPPYAPRHDLGFYEILWSLAVSGLFLYLSRKKRATGFYLALAPLLYAPVRFFLDFLRVPEALGGDTRFWGLTPAQYVAIAMLGLAAWMMHYVLHNTPKSLPKEFMLGEDGEPRVKSAAVADKPAKTPVGKKKKRP